MVTTTLTEYFARTGSHFSKVDAQVIGPELERLSKAGKSTARNIVDAARPDNAPLHQYFEWDDSEAAEKYRESQARLMTRSIIIKVPDSKGSEKEIRAFYPINIITSTPISDEPQEEVLDSLRDTQHPYIPWNVVVSKPEYADQVIKKAKQEMIGWQVRYETYRSLLPTFAEKFAPLFSAIEKIKSEEEKVA